MQLSLLCNCLSKDKLKKTKSTNKTKKNVTKGQAKNLAKGVSGLTKLIMNMIMKLKQQKNV